MANLNETAAWESGVYRIETTDPILGGETGTANIQAKQLANRTLWLKARADQVDAAAAGYGSLQARLATLQSQVEAVGADMQNVEQAAVLEALMQARTALGMIDALRIGPWQQQGGVTIANRGVVGGCVVSKSTTAARNLNITPGRVFANGRTYVVLEGTNAASVPPNTGSGAVTVSAYLYPHSAGDWRLAVTAIGQSVPAGGMEIYRLTLPANSTDATDPNLTGVTLTDVRRIEADWPELMSSPPEAQVLLPRALRSSGYRLHLEPVAWSGPQDRPEVQVASRASNGFTLRLISAHDAVTLRWGLQKLDD
ncbi:hypothetical protein [Caldimonas manganoxidans]|uniref:hypothetical protein n=1 Tax=Caldimonas manganoxidans TaxID=196015 RepID=UPI0003622872|nr:hypothetical protein [Caldimonas manganoxidans]